MKQKIKFIYIILGLFLSVVIFYNFYIANKLKYEVEGDAADFISLGVTLAKTHKYGHLEIPGGVVKALKEGTVAYQEYIFKGNSTWRPPVWPFFIAIVFLVFGYNLTYLLIFKFALHLFGTFIFYKISKLLKIREIFIIVGVFLYGISPAWQLYSRVFLSEPITLFLITLWVFFLLQYIIEKKGFLPQAITGGIIILAHPYYIFLPFTVWFILLLQKQIKWKIFIISSAICAAVVSIWIIRNFVVLDTSQIVLTTSSGAVMAKGWNTDVPYLHTNTKGDLANEKLVLQDFDSTPYGSGEVQRMQLYKDATIHFIKENQDLMLPIILKKLKSAFNPFPETPRPGVLETGRVIFQFLALLSIIYILLCSRNKLILAITYGLILSTVAITIITYSGFRFRMPQTVLELILILYALQMGYENWNSHRKISDF